MNGLLNILSLYIEINWWAGKKSIYISYAVTFSCGSFGKQIVIALFLELYSWAALLMSFGELVIYGGLRV